MMKQLFIYVAAICLAACSSDENCEVLSADTGQFSSVSVVSVVDGMIVDGKTRSTDPSTKVLAFNTDEDFKAFKSKLLSMDDEQKRQYVKEMGVVSLKELEKIADEELEIIGNDCKDEAEFRQRYAQYKRKYSGILIADDDDETDLNLYAPDGEKIESYIANRDQIYVVNDRVVHANLENKVSSIKKDVIAQASNDGIPTNSGEWSPKSGKKVYFEATRTYNEVHVSAHARKKMWYGWKNDPSRTYYMVANLSNFIYYSAGKYGQRVESTTPEVIYVFEHDVSDGFSIDFGRATNSLFGTVTGRVLLWTDMTVEFDENGEMRRQMVGGHHELVYDSHGHVISDKLVDQYEAPICLEEKAHVVNICL